MTRSATEDVGARLMMNCDATSAVAVVVNTAGEPTPAVEALSFLVPTCGPTVQLPTVAIPETSVTAFCPVNEPPPLVIANATVAPLTTCPPASVSCTDGAVATAVATVGVCPSPL